MLNNVVVNIGHCGQQNIEQSCASLGRLCVFSCVAEKRAKILKHCWLEIHLADDMKSVKL